MALTLKAIIILLTFATAIIHASFYFAKPSTDYIYALNALGYLTLLALLYLPIPILDNLRGLIRASLMAYAAITIAAYFAFGLVTNEWTVPLGLGITKTTVFNRRPMNIGLQYYHNVVHPDSGPSDQVRIVLALLYPTARRPEGKK